MVRLRSKLELDSESMKAECIQNSSYNIVELYRTQGVKKTNLKRQVKRRLWKVLNDWPADKFFFFFLFLFPRCKNPMKEECHDGSLFWKDAQPESVWRIYWRGEKEIIGKSTR